MTNSSTSTHSLPLAAGRWALDPLHCTVEFTARHIAISKVRGRFRDFDANLVVGASLADSRLSTEIRMASVDTGNPDRDTHLRSDDFFDVERHPAMTFASTSIAEAEEGRYRVVGDLTIMGVTRSETLDVEFHGIEIFPGDGSTHAGFEATGEIRRSDYGIDFNVPLGAGGFVVSDRIGIELDVQLLPAEGEG